MRKTMARNFGLPKSEIDPDSDVNVDLARSVWTAVGIVVTFTIGGSIIVLAWLTSMMIGWPFV